MASSAPFGTDLQPVSTVRIVGGKLLYAFPPQLADTGTNLRAPYDESLRGGSAERDDDVVSLVKKSFCSVINKRQCLDDIYQSCSQLDYARSGMVAVTALLHVMASCGVVMEVTELSKLAKTVHAVVGEGKVRYPQVCALLSQALSEAEGLEKSRKSMESSGKSVPRSVGRKETMDKAFAEKRDANSASCRRWSQDTSSQHDAHKRVERSHSNFLSTATNVCTSITCPPLTGISYSVSRNRQQQLKIVAEKSGTSSLLEGMSSLRRALHKCSTVAGQVGTGR